MSVSESPSFDIWPEGVQGWFERRLRIGIGRMRDHTENPGWLREALADQAIVEWVVLWFCGYMDDYIKPADPDEVWVTDVQGDGRRIGYDRAAVFDQIQGVVRRAQMESARKREAEKYPDLDTWLEALHAGQLEWDGPSEQDGEQLVDDRWDFQKVARHRRNHWPKRCRVCGDQFRPKPANVKSCDSCLGEIRAERQAKRRAGAR